MSEPDVCSILGATLNGADRQVSATPATLPRSKTASIPRRLPPYAVFLLIAGINVLMLCILTPPFEVHDEFQHYFRSYQLSEGSVMGTVRHGVPGAVIPESLPSFVMNTWGTLHVWQEPPLRAQSLDRLWHNFKQPLAPDRKAFTHFLMVSYSPIMYVPQALAMTVGRWFSLSPLGLLYAARLANALTLVAITAAALWIMPAGSELALAIVLLPGCQYEFGSVAEDGVIIAATFMFCALVMRSADKRSWSAGAAATAMLAGSVVCAKLVYAPLLFLALPLRLGGGISRRLVLVDLAIGAVSLGTALIWYHLSGATLHSFLLPPSRIALKEHLILSSPLQFAWSMLLDLRHHGFFYFQDAIGWLGVWRVPLPVVTYLLAVVALLGGGMVSIVPGGRGRSGLAAWCLLLGAAVVVLLETAMFLVNSPAGTLHIDGMQGRYFLPLGALAAVCVPGIRGVRLPVAAANLIYIEMIIILILNTGALDYSVIFGFHLLR